MSFQLLGFYCKRFSVQGFRVSSSPVGWRIRVRDKGPPDPENLTQQITGAQTPVWEFPEIRGTLFWGPYNKDPTI